MPKSKELVWIATQCKIDSQKYGSNGSLAGAIFMHIKNLEDKIEELKDYIECETHVEKS